jgi:hypothetical protein
MDTLSTGIWNKPRSHSCREQVQLAWFAIDLVMDITGPCIYSVARYIKYMPSRKIDSKANLCVAIRNIVVL